MPLTSRDGFHVGTLCALDHAPRQFSATEIDILTNLADIVVEELELRHIARYDHLTGVLSRRAFFAEAAQTIARRDRYGRPAALLLFDLDHFKAINEIAGHAGGDAVLRTVAQCCGAMLRTNDMLGRVGGEEFGILLPELDGEAALAAANRFREAIAGLVAPGGRRITASFGVAALAPDMAVADAWLAHADAAMFAAKRAGRNCCRLAGGRTDATAARQ